MKKKITIATRKSPMAMWQAEYVKSLLASQFPAMTIELCPLVTEGDRRLDQSLAKIGGKGLFLKELEHALLRHDADCAVHSVKDIPAILAPSFRLVAYLERTEVRDAFVSERYGCLAECEPGSKIGTSSLRRSVQLGVKYPQCQFEPVRGNVNTRLAKLQQGDFDGLIVSAIGLERLSLAHHIKEYISTEDCLPAIGQGGLAIECLREADELGALLQKAFDHITTRQTIEAERAVGAALGASCTVPIAVYGQQVSNRDLWLQALVGAEDGSQILRAEARGDMADSVQVGRIVAEKLLQQGAGALL